jgi:hypothetical protein
MRLAPSWCSRRVAEGMPGAIKKAEELRQKYRILYPAAV